jgi:hypothetical protein
LPDPRRQDLCVYTARQLWWQVLLTFLLRGGSRNAFDADRNSGQLPQNLLSLCEQTWNERRLGARRTVTCSGNATRQASRVAVEAVAGIPVLMLRRLLQMRCLESARLFDTWWPILIDGTLQDRGRDTPQEQARYRYVLEAKLVGPEGLCLHVMTEFEDVRDPILDKADCELNAFKRLAKRLHAQLPRLSLALVLDGLYPVEGLFDICQQNGWRFIATLREGRQRNGWDEAVQTMMLSPGNVLRVCLKRPDGPVEQTFRWTERVAFGRHEFPVLFCGEISPTAATLWCWVTNFRLDRERVYTIANQGGRSRQGIETVFNVQKNGGFGLEHAFCANAAASQNYHLLMQIAHTLWQLLSLGRLRRLTRQCRKVSDSKLVQFLRSSLLTLPIPPDAPPLGQLRFAPSS